MIEVEIWYYVESASRVVRMSRIASLPAVPFVGVKIEFDSDNAYINEVTFQDNGGIICVADSKDRKINDSEMDDLIDSMKDFGWKILSDEKKRKRK